MQQQNVIQDGQSIDENISKLYQLLEFKGKGAYGVIWKAMDRQTKKIVALKKVFDAFSNDTDAQRTYREVIYLQQLTYHENIVKLLHIHRAMNMKDLYMTFEYVESDLHKVIRANLLEGQHMIYVLYQILKCLKYIHSGGLIHRDLKPSNILIDSDCRIKLADFGLARLATDIDEFTVMTDYVATRWYRSPEILLGSPIYNNSVDMWSVGCILGEMVLSKSIFTGQSTLNQLEKIVEVLGKPSQEDLEQINAPIAEKIFREIQMPRRKSLFTYIKSSDIIIDFISKCLTWNPNKRMTVDQALQHPLLNDFRGTERENNYPSKITIELSENVKLDKKKYREILYKMDVNYQKQQYIKQLSNEEQIPSAIKSKKLSNQIQQTYQKYLNNGIDSKYQRVSKSSSKPNQFHQNFQSQMDIQSQILLTQSIQQQNQQIMKQKMLQNRIKTLPENYVDIIIPTEPKSPNRERYFSQIKITSTQPQIPQSSTPIRSKSMKNRLYNESADHCVQPKENDSKKKLLTAYLSQKPKRPLLYNFKKTIIRNKISTDQQIIKKHLAHLNNMDTSNLVSIAK
ncbi:unnamed protein product [Paramecium octaurelia]|uniref:mitogen-activated protein kinase n=1 Tax=Paramecium octaurelia TaxID=43137 RepID=A0A8S1T7Q4_PAROT|nr:unnamed protein product [Paramecium octaurelia]